MDTGSSVPLLSLSILFGVLWLIDEFVILKKGKFLGSSALGLQAGLVLGSVFGLWLGRGRMIANLAEALVVVIGMAALALFVGAFGYFSAAASRPDNSDYRDTRRTGKLLMIAAASLAAAFYILNASTRFR